MPAESALTPLGQEWREELPVVLRDSPDHLAVLHSVCREIERCEAAIETVRDQFFPTRATLLLGVWERLLGLTAEPEGVSLEDRRLLVLVYLRKMRNQGSGTEWQQIVTRLVGPSWSHQEHDPADPDSPPADTLRVTLPFPPTSSVYARIERLLGIITPAHLDLEVVYDAGFVLDESQLDQEVIQ